jgi:Arylsulfotransferase (ASST)
VVFSWNATEHVALNETYNDFTGVGTEAAPFDYFHINSVEKDAKGDYLVSPIVLRQGKSSIDFSYRSPPVS